MNLSRLATRASWALALLSLSGPAMSAEPTFAERLGWPAGTVAVILHVDDVGMSHPSNAGAIEALERGVATSFSVMMPCPWVTEIARYAKAHPGLDGGLHLTLTSEWQLYRWGPLAGKPQVPGLVDPDGCLWRSVAQVVTKATPEEIETEIRAQIDRAEGMGLPITHLDSHMGTLFARRDYFERFLKVGLEKRIPILAVGGHAEHALRENGEAVKTLRSLSRQIWNGGLPLLDDLHTSSGDWPADAKPARLAALLKDLKPGVTEILFHASKPTDEFPLVTNSSASRRGDLEALTSPVVRKLIEERGIVLTTWKELKERRSNAPPLP